MAASKLAGVEIYASINTNYYHLQTIVSANELPVAVGFVWGEAQSVSGGAYLAGGYYIFDSC
jgi:hypothetical protein